jgi:DNA polymerase I-like protein with 3'-5' exonuclease and polymerase domains
LKGVRSIAVLQGVGDITDKPVRRLRTAKKDQVVYLDPAGREMTKTLISKRYRDVLEYWHGITQNGDRRELVFDPHSPIPPNELKPGPDSPICKQCAMYLNGCKAAFRPYEGPKNPLVTIVYEGVTSIEDDQPTLASAGNNGYMRRMIEDLESETGVSMDQIRWVPVVRCADRTRKANLKVKANWCRFHIVEELMFNPPQLILAVGTVALGALCHKSNAEDWQGKVLTYRGWPDDWLMDEQFMSPRPNPADDQEMIVGHPLFGPAPTQFRIPIIPIQTPRLIRQKQNPNVTTRWRKAIKEALIAAREGIEPNTYLRPWYRYTNNPDEVAAGLREIINNPGMVVCFDTETTGLKPLAVDAAIVAMMFRWTNPSSGEPRSLGFPWNFRSSHYDNKIVDHIDWLSPLVLDALSCSKLVAHNATFDFLYTLFNVKRPEFAVYGYKTNADLDTLRKTSTEFNRAWDAHLVALANAFLWDTWHMAYTLRQTRGTLGLEMLAYLYAKDMAGYEEDMTMLIARREWQLHPGSRKAVKLDEDLVERAPSEETPVKAEETPPAAEETEEPDGKKKKKARKSSKVEHPEEPNPHYLNIEEEFYPTHVVPYIMGDVETCYQAREVLDERLGSVKVYKIPLADPDRPGHFRMFETPSRKWVYENVMSPAARTLMCVMARGMYVDRGVLTEFEQTFPREVRDARKKVSEVNEAIKNWCEAELAQDPDWHLDLENKAHLRYILFGLLNLPVQRLTKSGRKLFGELPEEWEKRIAAGEMTEEDKLKYAALDKFTLNKLAVDHPEVRPLQKYRQVFKLYSTYIRPLRNIFEGDIDKKEREKDAHLCWDSCVHAQFLLTGTRTGRLSSRDPNLQQLPNKGLVKQLFVSRFGERGCMYQADLSQIELRLMACACGDPTMIKAYYDKTDLHTLTTSRIYKLPYENFSKEYFEKLDKEGRTAERKELELKRRIGKTVNFLTGYGGGALGLQTILANNEVYMSQEECEKIIEAFFDAYPSLRKFLSYYKRFITETGVAVSVFGRVRILEEVFGDDREAAAKALRAGCNHVIQSTASDMMLTALRAIELLMRAEGLESVLVSTVHDSLLIDAVRSELPRVHAIVHDVLNNFPEVMKGLFGDAYDLSWLTVPIVGDCEVGLTYYDSVKIPVIPHDKIDWDALLAA